MLRLTGYALIFVVGLVPNTSLSSAESPVEANNRVIEVEVPAPALEGNLLGSLNSQGAAIYLPPSYDLQPERRFPTIYFLHGIFDDYGVWIENYDLPLLLDQLIASKRVPEVIAVLPNGGNRYGGGYYRNSPVSGDWGDYIAKDLVGYVDDRFRTLPSPSSRAIVGHSMGGYGAINQVMNHPGIFSVVWALSPCCLAPTDDLGFGNEAWRRAAAIAGEDDIQDLLERRDFYPIAILGLVAAFSPDPTAAPVYGAFPFDLVAGELVLDNAAFDRYREAFPSRQVRQARDNLRALRGLGLGVGINDQFLHILSGTLDFSKHLGAERIAHRLDLYDGDHRNRVGDRLENDILPWVTERLETGE